MLLAPGGRRVYDTNAGARSLAPCRVEEATRMLRNCSAIGGSNLRKLNKLAELLSYYTATEDASSLQILTSQAAKNGTGMKSTCVLQQSTWGSFTSLSAVKYLLLKESTLLSDSEHSGCYIDAYTNMLCLKYRNRT